MQPNDRGVRLNQAAYLVMKRMPQGNTTGSDCEVAHHRACSVFRVAVGDRSYAWIRGCSPRLDSTGSIGHYSCFCWQKGCNRLGAGEAPHGAPAVGSFVDLYFARVHMGCGCEKLFRVMTHSSFAPLHVVPNPHIRRAGSPGRLSLTENSALVQRRQI
jgi:hypothetical protein